MLSERALPSVEPRDFAHEAEKRDLPPHTSRLRPRRERGTGRRLARRMRTCGRRGLGGGRRTRSSPGAPLGEGSLALRATGHESGDAARTDRRLPHAERTLLRPQPLSHAEDRPGQLLAPGRRGRRRDRTAPRSVHAGSPAAAYDHRLPRMCRQLAGSVPGTHRHPSQRRAVVHGRGWMRGVVGALPGHRPRTGRRPTRSRRREPRGPGQFRLRARHAARQGSGSGHLDRASHERGAAPRRPRVSGPVGRARMVGFQQHQVAGPDPGLHRARMEPQQHEFPTSSSATSGRPRTTRLPRGR